MILSVSIGESKPRLYLKGMKIILDWVILNQYSKLFDFGKFIVTATFEINSV